MDTLETIYGALSDALDDEPVTNEREALFAIGRLTEHYQQACRAVMSARGAVQELINKDLVVATVKFNGGNPVVLCAVCNRIIGYSPPQKAKAGICEDGQGCGAFKFDAVAALFKNRGKSDG